MTRSCREVRIEGLKLYYARNDFRASYCHISVRQLCQWLRCIGAHNRGLLQSLEIYDVDYDGEPNICMDGEDLSDSECEDAQDEDPAARRRLLAFGAIIEKVKGALGVYKVTFPKVKAKE